MSRRHLPYHVAAMALVLLAFGLSATISRTTFERLPQLEDEIAYWWQAQVFARGQLVMDSPDPALPFYQPFVLDYEGHKFGKYMPGWPFFLSIGFLLGQPWFVNAAFAALSVALLYRFSSQLFNADTGIIAALLLTFSPVALLLNASLMSHTVSLFFALAFAYAYYRMQRAPHARSALRFGILAGLALGVTFTNRSLTGVGIALPFVVYSGAQVARTFLTDRASLRRVLVPLLALSAAALVVLSSIFVYRYAATGDPLQDLYVMVEYYGMPWTWDRIGFGDDYGINSGRGQGGYTLANALSATRSGVTLMSGDVFGWALGFEDLGSNGRIRVGSGVSLWLVPFGVVAGLFWRRRIRRWPRVVLAVLWLALVLGWLAVPFNVDAATLSAPSSAWLWVIVALGIINLPPLLVGLARDADRPALYTTLFGATVMSLVVGYMVFWANETVYGSRYFYEAIGAVSILTALPLAWFIRRFGRAARAWVLIPLVLMTAIIFFSYSLPRIHVLHRFRSPGMALIEAVEARRESPDTPLLVIVLGPLPGQMPWWNVHPLLAATSPALDSEIVMAYDNGDTAARAAVLERFADRQIIVMRVLDDGSVIFGDEPDGPRFG